MLLYFCFTRSSQKSIICCLIFFCPFCYMCFQFWKLYFFLNVIFFLILKCGIHMCTNIHLQDFYYFREVRDHLISWGLLNNLGVICLSSFYTKFSPVPQPEDPSNITILLYFTCTLIFTFHVSFLPRIP